MKLPLLPLFLLAGLALTARATDLTPRYLTTMTEGVRLERPYFADGDKKFGIKLDSETKLSAADGGALFRFEKFATANMLWRHSTMPVGTVFGPESLELYQKTARSLLPPGAETVVMAASEYDTLPMNDWQSLRVTFSYTIANQSRRQSVTFLNLKPDEQITIQTVADDRDFDEVAGRAYNIIRRWYEIVPDKLQPYN